MRKLMLITGGTSGIGLGIALACAKQYDLALSYAGNHDRAAQSMQALKEIDPECRVEVFPKPLMSIADCEELIKKIDETFGSTPDVLVNSAGRLRDGMFMSVDAKIHQDMVSEHLVVPMTLTQLCMNKMYKQKFGRIINMSSITAQRAKKGQVNYSTVKSGIEGFTRGMALEVAHRGVTVNAIAPGIINTPMTSDLMGMIESANKKPRDVVPAGFFGEPSDIGEIVSFLCSLNGRYITGQTIKVDGGRSLGEVK